MNSYISHAGSVLAIFLIPFGGGIPAGVLKAQEYGLIWPVMCLLYFISDLILALIFEPLMLLFIHFAKRHEILKKMGVAFSAYSQKVVEQYGKTTGVLALIFVAFGVDPMTGRSVAKANGHGPISGWAIAIIGDMFYFALIMVSTLWLNQRIGNENWTMAIILVLMMILPQILKKK